MDSKFPTKLDKILHVVPGEETPPGSIFPAPPCDCWNGLEVSKQHDISLYDHLTWAYDLNILVIPSTVKVSREQRFIWRMVERISNSLRKLATKFIITRSNKPKNPVTSNEHPFTCSIVFCLFKNQQFHRREFNIYIIHLLNTAQ
jgi:hypothetical protein